MQKVMKLIADEQDRRVKICARVRLAGEPTSTLARALGYAGSSGIYQTVTRLQRQKLISNPNVG